MAYRMDPVAMNTAIVFVAAVLVLWLVNLALRFRALFSLRRALKKGAVLTASRAGAFECTLRQLCERNGALRRVPTYRIPIDFIDGGMTLVAKGNSSGVFDLLVRRKELLLRETDALKPGFPDSDRRGVYQRITVGRMLFFPRQEELQGYLQRQAGLLAAMAAQPHGTPLSFGSAQADDDELMSGVPVEHYPAVEPSAGSPTSPSLAARPVQETPEWKACSSSRVSLHVNYIPWDQLASARAAQDDSGNALHPLCLMLDVAMPEHSFAADGSQRTESKRAKLCFLAAPSAGTPLFPPVSLEPSGTHVGESDTFGAEASLRSSGAGTAPPSENGGTDENFFTPLSPERGNSAFLGHSRQSSHGLPPPAPVSPHHRRSGRCPSSNSLPDRTHGTPLSPLDTVTRRFNMELHAVVVSGTVYHAKDLLEAQESDDASTAATEDDPNALRHPCFICYQRPREVLLLPCGHFNMCGECVHKLERPDCPMDRALIRHVVDLTDQFPT